MLCRPASPPCCRRFTAPTVRAAYQYPASHLVNVGGGGDAGWMGMRARLRRSFSCLALKTSAARVICAALKKHGLILADVGSPWYLTGEATPLWQTRLGANYDQCEGAGRMQVLAGAAAAALDCLLLLAASAFVCWCCCCCCLCYGICCRRIQWYEP